MEFGIADCLVEYYQELFSSTNLEHCDTTINSIQKIISLEMNSQQNLWNGSETSY